MQNFDFQSLLQGILGGEDGTLDPTKIVKRHNGAPPITLTPSQQAVSEVADGYHGAETRLSGGLHAGVEPVSQGSDIKGMFGGILANANRSIQSAMNAPQPSMESMGMNAGMMQQRGRDDYMSNVPGYAPGRAALGQPLRAFAHGGVLRPGETGLVGDGGNGDPTDDELIHARADGSVEITPLHGNDPPPVSVGSADLPAIPQRTYEGTGLGGLGTAVDASQPVQPDASLPSDVDVAYGDVIAAQRIKPLTKWQKFGDAMFGALQGANNFFNNANNPIVPYSEMKRERKLRPALQKLELLKDREKTEQDAAYRKAQIDKFKTDAVNQERDDKFRAEKNARDYELKVKTFDFKVEDRAEYYRLEQVKADAKVRNDQRMYDLAVRKQDEIERNNQARIDATNENVDRRINANPKNNPAPPRSSSPSSKGTKKNAKDPLNLFIQP